MTEDDREPFSENFELAGYDADLFILSIGAVWYYLIFEVLMMLIKQPFRCCPRIYQKLHSIANMNV